jgi:hypothetical protein
VKRRICWPDPDLTCLQGGCLHCEDHPFRSRRTILDWVLQHPKAPHRNSPELGSTINAFSYGVTRRRLWTE